MKNQSNKRYLALLTCCIFSYCTCAFILMQSCKRTQEEIKLDLNGTFSRVNIIMEGVDYSDSNQINTTTQHEAKENTIGSKELIHSRAQKFVIPFDDKITIFGSLIPVNTVYDQLRVKSNTDVQPTVLNSSLEEGVKYTVLVYNADGSLNQSKVLTHTPNTRYATFDENLEAGKTYTFIAVSLNSTSKEPTISGANLSNAIVTNATDNLMYFKQEMVVNNPKVNLNIVLKHQFSQITTKITINSKLNDKYLNSISNVFIKPQFSSANLKLSDGTLTYNTPVDAGAHVIFPFIDEKALTITSLPTNIIGPVSNKGILNIGSIAINGESKSNITESNLKIMPGFKYNLNLKFDIPCTEIVSMNGDFTINQAYNSRLNGSRTSPTSFSAPNADYGFILNIYELDNSFDMKINNVSLANNELQFQSGVTGKPVNIEFTDGKVWGTSDIDQIYNIDNGTDEAPVIRVAISPEGIITMYGRKNLSDKTLYPLKLKSGTFFNTVKWNKLGENIIVLDQTIAGRTVIRGNGIGKRIVACP